MKSTNRRPLEFTANPKKPKLNQRENRQRDFLHFLAQGESINDACALVGVTRSAYEQWRGRKKEFRPVVESAREAHRRGALCGFHTADSTPTTIDSATQPQHGNPDNPYKPPQPNSAPNHLQNQQDTSIQTAPEAPRNFSKPQTKPIPAKPAPTSLSHAAEVGPAAPPSDLASHELGAVQLPFMRLRSHRNHR